MTSKIKGQSVTRQGLADVFGVSLPTIDSWVRQGCPNVKKGGLGKAWEFDTAAVAQWQKEKAVEDATGGIDASEDELKKRKAQAETELVELELLLKKGELAPIFEFEKTWAMAFSALRQNILNVVQRAELALLGETDGVVFKAKLREELVGALEQTAATNLSEEDDLDD